MIMIYNIELSVGPLSFLLMVTYIHPAVVAVPHTPENLKENFKLFVETNRMWIMNMSNVYGGIRFRGFLGDASNIGEDEGDAGGPGVQDFDELIPFFEPDISSGLYLGTVRSGRYCK